MPPFSDHHIEQAAFLARKAIAGTDPQVMNGIAMELFQLQAQHVPVYSSFLKGLGIDPLKVRSVDDIPYLPIAFFRSHEVLMNGAGPVLEFLSSGTTGSERSKHIIADLGLYEQASVKAFEHLITSLEDLCILTLLPNYLEQQSSSLIHMVRLFMDHSKNERSGFFLDQFDELEEMIRKGEALERPTLLIGVPYALLDFLEDRKFDLEHTILMETGGMKGRRKELVRSDLHDLLKVRTGLERIYSEYGMTELLSQAYSTSDGIFKCPPWMRASIREVNDPLSTARQGKTGGINIMDLANAHSCAFISTMDLGRDLGNARFEVLGRFDNSDVRGCNLLIQ